MAVGRRRSLILATAAAILVAGVPTLQLTAPSQALATSLPGGGTASTNSSCAYVTAGTDDDDDVYNAASGDLDAAYGIDHGPINVTIPMPTAPIDIQYVLLTVQAVTPSVQVIADNDGDPGDPDEASEGEVTTSSTHHIDAVTLNGVSVGSLRFQDDSGYTELQVVVPTSAVNLPNTFPAQPVNNTISVTVDPLQPTAQTDVISATLEFPDSLRPIVFVHGLGSADGREKPTSPFYGYSAPDDNGVMQPAADNFFDGIETVLNTDNGVPAQDMVAPTLTDASTIDANVAKLTPAVAYLMNQTGACHVDMVAHSMGGLDAREYIDTNPGIVTHFLMAGTPNGGTGLADLACNGNLSTVSKQVLKLLNRAFTVGNCNNPDTTALGNLRTGYVLNSFNVRNPQEYPDAAAAYAGVKSRGELSLTTKFVGDSPNDGVVGLDSVFALDAQRHDGTLATNHLDEFDGDGELSLGGDVFADLQHWTQQPLSPDSQFAAIFAPTTNAAAPTAAPSVPAAPAAGTAVSAGDQMVPDGTYTVAPGSTQVIPPTADATDLAGAFVSSTSATTTATAGTSALTSYAPGDGTGLLYGTAGPNTPLTVTNPDATPVTVSVVLDVQSTRTLTATVNKPLLQPGQPVTVTAALTVPDPTDAPTAAFYDGSQNLAQTVSMTAVTGSPGLWTATYTPGTPGMWQTAVNASGPRPRAGLTNFTVSAETKAHLTSGPLNETLLDIDKDGLADSLSAQVPVTVTQSGGFELTADLVDHNGALVAHGIGRATLPSGPTVASVQFQGKTIYGSGKSGPYHLANVALFDLDGPGTLESLASSDTKDVTQNYTVIQFEHTRVAFTNSAWFGRTQTQAPYTSLDISGAVSVDTAGSYAVSGVLYDRHNTSVATTATTVALTSGSNPVTLSFSGQDIGASGLNGPYSLKLVSAAMVNDTTTNMVNQSAYSLADVYDSPAYAASDFSGYPVAAPTGAAWTTSSVTAGTPAGSPTVTAGWNSTQPAGTSLSGFEVQVSTDSSFGTVNADKTVAPSATTVTVGPADGVTPGPTTNYYFRVKAISAAGLSSGWSKRSGSSTQLDTVQQKTGPVIVHTPQTTAYTGQSIPITFTATCGQADAHCAGRLYWRPTTTPNQASQVSTAAGIDGWQLVTATKTGTVTVKGSLANNYAATIPGIAVTSTGVDYYLQADDDAGSSALPAEQTSTAIAGTSGTAPMAGGSAVVQPYFHVTTVAPPVIADTAPVFAANATPIPVTIRSTCSTATCAAMLHYRSSPAGSAATDLTAVPDWPVTAMQLVSSQPTGSAGYLMTYTATIPASTVTTTGVDYYVDVRDGATTGYDPGTTYVGYYAPTDGMRTAYHHVHVLQPSSIVHTAVTNGAYHQPIPITATATCAAGATCTGTLYWRTTTSGANVFDPASTFTTSPLTVVAGLAAGTVTLTGTIPATATDTRGVDYFLSVTDTHTTSYYPGTSQVDGYAAVPGTQVGYVHVHVVEPVHLLPQPVPTAAALQALTVTTQLTCANAACTANLVYSSDPSNPSAQLSTVGMTRTSSVTTPTAGVRLETWSATIPAAAVTTRGVGYYLTASDGYTNAAAPGTSYLGDYVALDGAPITVPSATVNLPTLIPGVSSGNVVLFPVHVVEPPHLVHVPTATATVGTPVPLTARSNCSSPTCTGTLQYRPTGSLTWTSVIMNAVSPTKTQPLWTYTATIPGTAWSNGGVDYLISATDGYATDMTPSYTVQPPPAAPTLVSS